MFKAKSFKGMSVLSAVVIAFLIGCGSDSKDDDGGSSLAGNLPEFKVNVPDSLGAGTSKKSISSKATAGNGYEQIAMWIELMEMGTMEVKMSNVAFLPKLSKHGLVGRQQTIPVQDLQGLTQARFTDQDID